MNINEIPERVHFVGIGGVGQSALAQHLLRTGHKVSGSDKVDGKQLEKLRNSGAIVHIGHDAANVDGAQLVVRTSAVGIDNVEVLQAQKMGIPVVLREQLLGAIVNDFDIRICISGTHGKTTTTAMVSHVLRMAGVSHAAFIGGDFGGSNYLYGKGIALCEACEYNRSFLQLKPTVAVCLNAEFDHPDCYADQRETENAFAKFVASAKNGIAVLPVDLAYFAKGKAELCGDGGSVCVSNIKLCQGIPSFDIFSDGCFVAGCKLRVKGLYNVQNALFAFAVCKCLNVPLLQAVHSLCTFGGVDRRWNELPCNCCRIVVDYAHHPTEISASLSTAKSMCNNTVCVFQPHTFSRTKAFMQQFANCFVGTKVIFLPIFAAREQPVEGVDSASLAALANRVGAEAYFANDFAEAKTIACNLLQDKSDILLILGAGDVVNFADYFADNVSLTSS